MAGADGGVFALGAAPFAGSASGLGLRAPAAGIAPTPTGRGYWLAGADGDGCIGCVCPSLRMCALADRGDFAAEAGPGHR